MRHKNSDHTNAQPCIAADCDGGWNQVLAPMHLVYMKQVVPSMRSWSLALLVLTVRTLRCCPYHSNVSSSSQQPAASSQQRQRRRRRRQRQRDLSRLVPLATEQDGGALTANITKSGSA